LVVKLGGILFCFMNWSEKAEEIAGILIDELEANGNSYSKDKLSQCVRRAAILGMEFECDNWILKRR